MNTDTIKVKKGGLDTIIAFIVVLLPLVYVLIFMVATLYHFSVQMYINQVVKETLVMASTYGTLTKSMENDMVGKLSKVMDIPVGEVSCCKIEYYVREFTEDDGKVLERTKAEWNGTGTDARLGYTSKKAGTVGRNTLDKADLFGIYVTSTADSLLAKVSNFDIFKYDTARDKPELKYSSYREEIIRNEAP